MLGSFLGQLADLIRSANPIWLFTPLAGGIAVWVCRRDNVEAIEVGRTRNVLGMESTGWINLFDKEAGKWYQIAQGGMISQTQWKVFREQVRAEARHEDPTDIAIPHMVVAGGTTINTEVEQLVLRQR